MKKQNLKKHCLLLLSILCLSGTALEMTACADAGSTAETADGTAAVTAAESVTQTETEPELLPDVPQTDMNGKTIHIFQQDWGTYKPLAITDITTKLSYKFIQDDEYIKGEIASSGHRTLLLKLNVEHMCGKLVTES